MYVCVYVKCTHEKTSVIFSFFFLHNLSLYETYVVSLYAIKYVKKKYTLISAPKIEVHLSYAQ